ncbi:hypothetical protein [Serratia ureilytica]|uniref:hypothetical protein n=1 Tax=Serratia ureilytica TaxID=300181 RepID=UPI001B9DFF71|nr:hypothetical protein [Serratia ureilytica]HBC5194908.1 hypothetical protein [Serratia marcescens]
MKEKTHIDINRLKESFKEGATPNEQDYGNLIDLASVGSKALGAAATDATTPVPGSGLEAPGGKLAVKAGRGVLADGNGVAVKVDDKTLSVTKDNALALKLKPEGGLEAADAIGLHIKAGIGLKADAKGLSVILDSKGGLKTDNNMLAVAVDGATSGLTFDIKGALKVHLAASGENYLTTDAKGLAITKTGIEKIKAMLEAESTAALQKAVEHTDHGEHPDTASGGAVETAIAGALNTAYTKGYEKKHTQNQLTVKAVEHHVLDVGATNATVPLRSHLTADSTLASPHFYFMPVQGDETHWRQFVGPQGVSASGDLHLSAATVGQGKVKVLALAVANAASGPGLNIAAAEVTVEVTVRPVVKGVSISPGGYRSVYEPLTLACSTVPTAGVVCTYRWETRKTGSEDAWQSVAGATAQTWTPGAAYIDHEVRGFVVPAMEHITGIEVHSRNPVTLYDRPLDIDHIDVNGYTFKHDEGFPTTAFKAARFTLVLPAGMQASDYSWTTDADNAIKVTGEAEGGVVTFVSKPARAQVTISGRRIGHAPVEYRFTLKHWFTNIGNQAMTWSEANEACKHCDS